jgi:hypothetical protein
MGCEATYIRVYQGAVLHFDNWRALVGDDGVALTLIAITSIALLLLLQHVNAVVIPLAVQWLRDDCYQKARKWFDENTVLRFAGFRFKTYVAAVLMALTTYALLKVAIRVPAHWVYSVALFTTTGAAFSVAGLIVSPNIRLGKFFRHFYVPALIGGGFAILDLLVDFLLEVLAALVALLPPL